MPMFFRVHHLLRLTVIMRSIVVPCSYVEMDVFEEDGWSFNVDINYHATNLCSTHHPLVFVAHQGPVSLHNDGSWSLNAGGLATALAGLSFHCPTTWIALTEPPSCRTLSNNSGLIELTIPRAGNINFYGTVSDTLALEMFYSVVSNTILWFLQHSLPIPTNAEMNLEMDAFESGYQVVNKNLAIAVLQQIETHVNPIILLQDYHTYLVASMVRAVRPDARLLHFIHIPWPSIEFWYYMSANNRQDIFNSLLDNDIIGFQTEIDCKHFLQCCSHFLDLPFDEDRGIIRIKNREVWVHSYPVPINPESSLAVAYSPEAFNHVVTLQENITNFTIVVVARTDLSKNLAQTFDAFGIFLQKYPEFRRRVMLFAHVVPSRLNIPAYQTHLLEVQTVVKKVNAAFSSLNWIPIDFALSKSRERAMALLRLYDVLIVNSIADGMNLVAKEGALVNEMDGILILSKTAGVIQELGNYTLNVDPNEKQQLVDSLYLALTMNRTERKWRSNNLQTLVKGRNPDQWLNKQLDDLIKKTS